MTPVILKRDSARQDLLESYVFIGAQNPEAAERFLLEAENTFQLLASMPYMGTSRIIGHPELKGLRSFRFRGFENYLVFYRPIESGIELIRVLHGARDIEGLLSAYPG